MTRPRKPPPRRLRLRARVLMAERGIRSVSELQRRLAAAGVTISVPQLIRVIDGETRHLNTEVLNGLLDVFGCRSAELLSDE